MAFRAGSKSSYQTRRRSCSVPRMPERLAKSISAPENLPEQSPVRAGEVYQIDGPSGGGGDTIRKILERVVIERLSWIDRDVDVAVRTCEAGRCGAEDNREIEVRILSKKGQSLARIIEVLHGDVSLLENAGKAGWGISDASRKRIQPRMGAKWKPTRGWHGRSAAPSSARPRPTVPLLVS